MSLDIENINPLAHEQWDKLILESNQYSFFHSYAWIKVLWESYGYKPHFFILKNKRELSALLPFMEVNSRYSGRRGVSLPFSDYCDPIISEEVAAREVGAVIDYLEVTSRIHGRGHSDRTGIRSEYIACYRPARYRRA